MASMIIQRRMKKARISDTSEGWKGRNISVPVFDKTYYVDGKTKQHKIQSKFLRLSSYGSYKDHSKSNISNINCFPTCSSKTSSCLRTVSLCYLSCQGVAHNPCWTPLLQ